MRDLYLTKDSAGKGRLKTLQLYAQVFQLHQVSREDFRKSFQFYSERPDLTRELFDSVQALGGRDRAAPLSRRHAGEDRHPQKEPARSCLSVSPKQAAQVSTRISAARPFAQRPARGGCSRLSPATSSSPFSRTAVASPGDDPSGSGLRRQRCPTHSPSTWPSRIRFLHQHELGKPVRPSR